MNTLIIICLSIIFSLPIIGLLIAAILSDYYQHKERLLKSKQGGFLPKYKPNKRT